MSDGRDPAIKLFGSTIPLTEGEEPPEGGKEQKSELLMGGDDEDLCRETRETEVRTHMSDASENLDRCELTSFSGLNNATEDGCETSTSAQEVQEKVVCKPDDGAEASTFSQVKLMKKPDKILPCPRCNSMDTKFCYYNNYNVNQPRHFCKNCQRYWTAGGTMRNVPVGAGRRKSRHSVSLNRPSMILSDGTPCSNQDAPDSSLRHDLPSGSSPPTRPFKGHRAVLKFGSEAADCEPTAHVLNLGDHERNKEMRSVDCGEKQDEPTHMSLMTDSNHTKQSDCPETAVHKEQNARQDYTNEVPSLHHTPSYSGSPFVFPWSPVWSNVAAVTPGLLPSGLLQGPGNSSPNSIPWNLPMLAAPTFCSPTIAFPFMPASFWSCMSSYPNQAWNVPGLGSHNHSSASSLTRNNGCSGNDSPTLGKHSRDADLERKDKTEKKSLWVPKTLRIDDPDEAAKSSIWDTLGIKPDVLVKKRGMFKPFQARIGREDIVKETGQILHANPAALCRSQIFQEST